MIGERAFLQNSGNLLSSGRAKSDNPLCMDFHNYVRIQSHSLKPTIERAQVARASIKSLRNNSGSFAMFAAMRLVSSFVSSSAAERRLELSLVIDIGQLLLGASAVRAVCGEAYAPSSTNVMS